MNAIKTFRDNRNGDVYADRYTKCLIDGTPYRLPVKANQPTLKIKVGKNWLYRVENVERLNKLQAIVNNVSLLDGVNI